MNALANSLFIAVGATALASLLGLLAALALFLLAPRRRVAVCLLALSLLPLLVPNYIVVSFWMEALGTNGWLARMLAGGRAVSLTGLWPSLLVLSLIYWPVVALIGWFTLTKIDRTMIEAAELALGRSRANWLVVAPLLWPSIAFSAVLVFVLTFSNFSVPATFLVKTIQNEIYVQFVAQFDVPRAFLAATPQMLAAVVLLGALWLWLRRRPWTAVAARPSGVQGGEVAHGRWPWAVFYLAGLILLSVIAPLLRAMGAVFEATVLWQSLLVSARQIGNSFLFAFLTASIVLALAVWSAVARHRLRSRGLTRGDGDVSASSRLTARLRQAAALRRLPFSPLDSLFLIPFVLPEILIGIALIAVFNRPSLQFLYTSVIIVLLALSLRYFIIGRLAIAVGRSHLDPSLLEAAELAGLPRVTMLFRIQLPLLARWLFAGWWLVYLFCLADVGSLVLIYPPGCDTVPIRIFNLLHYGYDAQVSALCLVMLALAVVPLMISPGMTRINANYDRMSPA
jgi:iron(III) transport system permease protein